MAKNGAGSMLVQSASRQAEPYMPPKDNRVGAAPMTPDELGLIKLWIDQGATGEVTHRAAEIHWQPLPPGVNPIFAVAMTEDGQWGACGRANQIFLYHLPAGRTMTRMTDPALLALGRAPGTSHLDMVNSLAFSPDGELLASGGYREIKLWRHPHNVHKFDIPSAPEAVTAFATSRDGRWYATGHPSGKVRVWDATNGHEAKTLEGHTGPITGVDFHSNGEELVSSSADKTVRRWKLADGSVVSQKEFPEPLQSVLWNQNDSRLVAAGEKTLFIWKFDSPELLTIDTGGEPITALVSRRDQAHVITGHKNGSVSLWNTDNKNRERQLQHDGQITALAIRGDGQQLATASTNNRIQLWRFDNFQAWQGQNNQPIPPMVGNLLAERRIELHDRGVRRAKEKVDAAKESISAAENEVKAADEAIKTGNAAKEKTAAALIEKQNAAKGPTEAKDAADKELEAAKAANVAAQQKANETKEAADKDNQNADLAKARDEAKRAADEAAGKIMPAEKKLAEAVAKLMQVNNDVAAAESAKLAAEQAVEASVAAQKKAADSVPVAQAAHKAAEEGAAAAQAALEGAKKEAEAQYGAVRALAYSPDQKTLASGGDNKQVRTWTSEYGQPIDCFVGHDAPITGLSFAGDSTILSAGGGAVNAWDPYPAWPLERTIGGITQGTPPPDQGLEDRVLALAFSADGKILASGGGQPSRSGELRLWNVADGALLRTISPSHSDTIFAIEFSPDNRYLASAGADRMMKVFDVNSGALVRTFEGHTHHVLGVSWRGDGKMLATAGADSAVKMWDFATGEQPRPPHTMGKEATAIRFLPFSSNVLVSSGDKQVHGYQTTPNSGQYRGWGSNDFLYSLGVSGDGKTLIAGGQEGILRYWNHENGQTIREFAPPPPDPATSSPK